MHSSILHRLGKTHVFISYGPPLCMCECMNVYEGARATLL